MEMHDYKAVLEGLLFVAGDEGVTSSQIEKILQLPNSAVCHLIEELKYDCEQSNRGMMIMQSNDLLHLATKPEHSEFYKRMLDTPHTSKLSQAALETLAIIAYKQPVTRAEIEEIRGVKSERPIQTLLARSMIVEAGRKEGIGRPILFATSKDFLTYFGLTSLEELPPLPDDYDSNEIEADADLFFERFQEHMDDENE
ncbi:SMC-Scp complex subunit ScpB [Virgibacillus halophilus]|uniref:SMC-Scp complex subunit ScpB n=1 Tax=Tigheibacillus halophilus TaxID=361280 RepID=UPI0036329E1E